MWFLALTLSVAGPLACCVIAAYRFCPPDEEEE